MSVEYDRRGTVAVVTIDRPDQRNTVDDATAEKLDDAWDRFDEDDDALVGVLTGSEGTFSAGADLEAMDLEDRPEGWLGFTRRRISKPTVAAVEGHCVAGGLEMALWCDLRVAGESATFGCFERRFGVPLVDGDTRRLPYVVGLGRAPGLILTGRELDAETAAEWGLVNRLAPAGAALETAVELAEVIAGVPAGDGQDRPGGRLRRPRGDAGARPRRRGVARLLRHGDRTRRRRPFRRRRGTRQ